MKDLRSRLQHQAVPFLACLLGCSLDDAWTTPVHFQTFTDPPPKPHPDPLAKHWAQFLDEAAPELERRNALGAGVYFTVNETDALGRSKVNIHATRGLHADLDAKASTAGFPETLADLLPLLPLEPTMAVRTPGGWHLYWLFPSAEPCDEASRAEHEAGLRRIQSALAHLGADKNACTVERVLRLPGFDHRKADPRPVLLVRADGPRYAREQVMQAFPVKPAKEAPQLRVVESVSTPPDRAEVLRLAGLYLDKLDPAIQGQGGSTATIIAARKIQDGFDLTEDEALDLLLDRYNPRCKPPWSEAELRKKVHDTASECQNRGHLLREQAPWPDEPAGAPGPRDAAAPPPGSPEDWPQPQPLTSRITAEPYPVEALPAALREAVLEVQCFVQAPMALVATSALSAVSLAAQPHFNVQRSAGLDGPISLFTLVVAESGERKSTVDGRFTASIREYEARQAEAAKPAIKAHRAAHGAWTAQRDGLLDAIRAASKAGKDSGDLERKLKELVQNEPEAPRVPRLVYGDATPESLKWHLAKSWPSGAVISSEAGIVFGGHGMNQESAMRNLATLNVVWDGGEIQTERRTSESFTLRGARLTMALQIQETTLRAFFEKSGTLARGSGFLARFLVAWPESTQGTRAFREAPPAWSHLDTFNRRLTTLLEMPAPLAEDGSLTPAVLTFSPAGKAAWVAFHDRIEAQLAAGGKLQDVRDVASKVADNAARIAALFHTFERLPGGQIGPDTFRQAGRIAEWHLNEAQRFFGELALPAGLANACRLDAWLVAACRRKGPGADLVPTKEVQQFGPSGLREKVAIDAAVEELAELDRARLVRTGKRRFVQLNPALLAPQTPATAILAIPATTAQASPSTVPSGSTGSRNSSSKPRPPMQVQPQAEPLFAGADL